MECHTAIPIWSGFLYQGKVAIYHVLSCLEKDINAKRTLQLDSLDDFAILNDDVIVSLHQVKALKSKRFASYHAAFSKLKSKSSICSELYLHIAQQLSDWSDEIETECSPVKLYMYASNPWCHLEEIDEQIELVVKAIYKKQYPSCDWRWSTDYLNLSRSYFDQLIWKKIVLIHAAIHAGASARKTAFEGKVPFHEFVNILNDDLRIRGFDEDYFFYRVQMDFHRYCQEFYIDLDEYDPATKKVSDYMLSIEKLDKFGLLRFIQNIMPHRALRIMSLQEYHDNTPQKDEVKQAFLRILTELRRTELCEKEHVLRWSTKAEKKYYPTMINAAAEAVRDICLNIVDNALNKNVRIMYEHNNLITLGIGVASILDAACRESDAGTVQDEDKKIMSWKTVSLVALENAKADINV